MKKLLFMVLALFLVVGSASADSYIGMFNNTTSHDGPEDSRVTVAQNEPYTVYLMVDADWEGFTSWELKMDKHSGDFLAGVTYEDPDALVLGSPFDYEGWAVTNPNSCWYGWNLVCTIDMVYAGEGAHIIEMLPWNLQPYPKYLNCAGEELPLKVIGPFGVNMDVVPAGESSWGAVKSMYK
ncbi:MAG: hypothetical protein U5O15_00945 [Candidatus Krumholzibacteriota bacterium]|nr:hypothetical protein [Candidatus Krumholzibacteriota bacterium]